MFGAGMRETTAFSLGPRLTDRALEALSVAAHVRGIKASGYQRAARLVLDEPEAGHGALLASIITKRAEARAMVRLCEEQSGDAAIPFPSATWTSILVSVCK